MLAVFVVLQTKDTSKLYFSLGCIGVIGKGQKKQDSIQHTYHDAVTPWQKWSMDLWIKFK